MFWYLQSIPLYHAGKDISQCERGFPPITNERNPDDLTLRQVLQHTRPTELRSGSISMMQR